MAYRCGAAITQREWSKFRGLEASLLLLGCSNGGEDGRGSSESALAAARAPVQPAAAEPPPPARWRLLLPQAMLKEGHKHLSGLEEAVLKNIEACKGLAQITRTSMGPNGAGGVQSRALGQGASVQKTTTAVQCWLACPEAHAATNCCKWCVIPRM